MAKARRPDKTGNGKRGKVVQRNSKANATAPVQQSGGKSKGTQTQVPKPEPNKLTVDGTEYAPLSLKKIIEDLESKGNFDNPKDKPEKSLTVLLNQTGNGLETDAPEVVNVMIADRIEQTKYFVDEIFPTLPRIPAYLYRYIQWIMLDNCQSNGKYNEMKYPTDNDYIQAYNSQVLTKADEEYQRIESFIKYAKSNTEATHLIGLLQLVGGTLRAYAKKNSGCRMYIELPETGFHPKRERCLVTLLYKLREDYGIKANWTEIEK